MRFSPKEITFLIQTIERDRLLIDGVLNKNGERWPIIYAGFKIECLLRIHVLPYFIPIKSYRHLAFEVAERPELQKIVGLEGPETPSRATLWHFRRKHSTSFRRLLARSLALISALAWQKNIQTYFSSPCLEGTKRFQFFDNFTDPKTKANIKILINTNSKEEPPIPTNALFPFIEPSKYRRKKKVNLHEEIEFPMLVHWSKGSESITLCVKRPAWPDLNEDVGALFGKAGKVPYVACNVIVFNKQSDHILLSKRQSGSGKGQYALPGGKKRDNETIRECVVRELKEEVGLEFRAGRIVSERVTNLPGFPRVKSIGVVATNWEGKLEKKEPYAHTGWDWYAIENLPEPIFKPTQLVLEDYLTGKSPMPSLEDLPLFTYGSSQNERR